MDSSIHRASPLVEGRIPLLICAGEVSISRRQQVCQQAFKRYIAYRLAEGKMTIQAEVSMYISRRIADVYTITQQQNIVSSLDLRF